MNTTQSISADDASASSNLTEGEHAFVKATQLAIGHTLEGRVPFPVTMGLLADAYQQIRSQSFDVDAAINAGFRPENLSAPNRFPAAQALSEREADFLKDTTGFLDFALRNGLTFPTIASLLFHDVAELSRHNWDLDALDKDCVRPKAMGWSKRNLESMTDDGDMRGSERGE